MANTIAVVFGILGNIASLITFSAPLPMCIHIYRGRSVFEYRSVPFVVSMLSQLTWLYYGLLLQRGAIFILLLSAIGCVFQTAFLVVYVLYAGPQLRRRTLTLVVWVDVCLFGMIFLVTFVAVRSFPFRLAVVGWSCVVTTMANFASPLSAMRQVIRTRTVESMPIGLSFAFSVNAGMWFAYGFVTDDLFIIIPNVAGLVLAAVQMLLYAYYRYLSPFIQHFREQPAYAI